MFHETWKSQCHKLNHRSCPSVPHPRPFLSRQPAGILQTMRLNSLLNPIWSWTSMRFMRNVVFPKKNAHTYKHINSESNFKRFRDSLGKHIYGPRLNPLGLKPLPAEGSRAAVAHTESCIQESWGHCRTWFSFLEAFFFKQHHLFWRPRKTPKAGRSHHSSQSLLCSSCFWALTGLRYCNWGNVLPSSCSAQTS